MRLDRIHWSLLAALRREGSLTEAAAALSVTQSAASQRLREAERRLGIALARKRGRSVVLSAAGERIADAGDALERTLYMAERDAIWVGRRTQSRLRIAWNHYDAPGMAALFAQVCAGIGGGVDLEFVRAAGEDAAVLLKRGDADFAVLPHDAAAAGIATVPLWQDRLVALVPPGLAASLATGPDPDKAMAIGPEAFRGRRYLTYGLYPRSGWEYDRFFDGGRTFPEGIVKVESTALITSLVGAGLGLSILPRRSVTPAAPGGPAVLDLAGPPIAVSWRLHSREAPPECVEIRLRALVGALRRHGEV